MTALLARVGQRRSQSHCRGRDNRNRRSTYCAAPAATTHAADAGVAIEAESEAVWGRWWRAGVSNSVCYVCVGGLETAAAKSIGHSCRGHCACVQSVHALAAGDRTTLASGCSWDHCFSYTAGLKNSRVTAVVVNPMAECLSDRQCTGWRLAAVHSTQAHISNGV